MTVPRIFLAAAILLAAVVSGCTSSDAEGGAAATSSDAVTPPVESLSGAWILTDLRVPSASPSRTEAPPPTLRIIPVSSGEVRFAGRGNCTDYEGRASVDQDSFELLPDGGLSFTELFCDYVAFEQAYLDTLREVSSWSLENDTLTLSSESDRFSVTFREDPTPSSEIPDPFPD